MDNIRFCIGCRERWIPGAASCPSCGFVPPDLTPVAAPSQGFNLKWTSRLMLILGLAAIPFALFDSATFAVRSATTHGAYWLWGQRERDRSSANLSSAASIVLISLALLLAVIRVVRGEEGAVGSLIMTVVALAGAFFFTLVAAILTT